MIADPPLAGAVQLTVADASPAVAVPIAGAAGAVAAAAGVTALDRSEKALVPIAFVAWTWNLTAVPLTSPVTTRLVAAASAGRSAPICTLSELTTLTE